MPWKMIADQLLVDVSDVTCLKRIDKVLSIYTLRQGALPMAWTAPSSDLARKAFEALVAASKVSRLFTLSDYQWGSGEDQQVAVALNHVMLIHRTPFYLEIWVPGVHFRVQLGAKAVREDWIKISNLLERPYHGKEGKNRGDKGRGARSRLPDRTPRTSRARTRT